MTRARGGESQGSELLLIADEALRAETRRPASSSFLAYLGHRYLVGLGVWTRPVARSLRVQTEGALACPCSVTFHPELLTHRMKS